MSNLRAPYHGPMKLPYGLVVETALNLFRINRTNEVRFERVAGTDLLYNAYYLLPNNDRPTTSGFDLVAVAHGGDDLATKLDSLTNLSKKPSLRVVRPNLKETLFAIFREE
ncbi:MAG: hypothetical protein AABW82_01440 [Nanoarchaeota archaeon]